MGRGLVQGAHLAELLLGVAPVWSAELLHCLGLADFHRTQGQRLDLQTKRKTLLILSSAPWEAVIYAYSSRQERPKVSEAARSDP